MALVNHLLRAGDIELDELEELRGQVGDAERGQKQPKPRSRRAKS
jgi:hypothetical protein